MKKMFRVWITNSLWLLSHHRLRMSTVDEIYIVLRILRQTHLLFVITLSLAGIVFRILRLISAWYTHWLIAGIVIVNVRRGTLLRSSNRSAFFHFVIYTHISQIVGGSEIIQQECRVNLTEMVFTVSTSVRRSANDIIDKCPCLIVLTKI